jgi:hypothetical protein
MRSAVIFATVLVVGTLAGAAEFTKDGQLVMPAQYREWIYLSTGMGMTYAGGGSTPAHPNFDNVFVNPEGYRGFVSTGKWPDGTMFVLEVRASESEGSINKGGAFQTTRRGIEMETKQNGKWTFYDFGGNNGTGKPFPADSPCNACHSQNGAVDNTFVQFYPTLLPIAKQKGTFKETH